MTADKGNNISLMALFPTIITARRKGHPTNKITVPIFCIPPCSPENCHKMAVHELSKLSHHYIEAECGHL